MNKILTILLVQLLFCCVRVAGAGITTMLDVGDFEIFIYEGNAAIHNYKGTSASIKLPSQFSFLGETYIIERIDMYAFSNNKTLQFVEFPETIKEIGEGAFYNCEKLWTLNLPSQLNKIGDKAFYGLKYLQSLCLPNSELEIGNEAFSGCESLYYLLVPEKVKSFGDNVFYSCNNLLEAYFLNPEAPEYTEDSFFNIALGAELYYPKGHYASYSYMFGFSHAYGRTKPAVCLNMVDISGAGKAQVLASAYGYLGATVESIEWESGNENVAIVDQNGLVTTVGPGKTDIFCTVTDSNGETASAYCTIKVPENTGVEDVEISAGASVEYFTLDGLPVGSDSSTLAPGIYIRRQGREVSKIMIK